MSRTMVYTMRICSLLAGLACLLLAPARSEPIVATPHATPKRAFTVCVLLLQSQKSPNGLVSYWNPDPWFFPVLDHSPFKPAGWTLDNPLAPARVVNDSALIASGDEYAKDWKGGRQTVAPFTTNWYLNGRDRTTLDTNPVRLTRQEPAYWAVKLDEKSLDALAAYDLLVLNVHAESKLSSADNRYLRILLDRGATIWVNDSQRTGAQISNIFLDPPVTFQTNPNATIPGTYLERIDQDSWLLNGVYAISDQEVNYLRDNMSNDSYISSGVAGMNGTQSLIKEVVRLQPRNKPVIATGNVGAGEIIFTCPDVMGAISDWWENIRNNSWRGDDVDPTRALLFNDLTRWPSHTALHNTRPIIKAIIDPTTRSILDNPLGTPNSYYSYVACSKFVFNMLARPANWHMVGGNAMGTRAFPQDFASVLQPAWSTRFAPVNDPVTFGSFAAVTGWNGAQSELRVYQHQDAGVTPALRELFPAKFRQNFTWIGSPVFGKILLGAVPVNVLYAMGYDQASASLIIDCYNLASANGDTVWTLSLPVANAGQPLASMTLSNNRLVVTTFGPATKQSPYHVFLIDAAIGHARAWLGTAAEDTAQYRFTGPASLVTVQLEFEMNRQDAGDTSAMPASAQANPDATWRQLEAVECLVAPGEYYSAETNRWASGIFLLPPRVIARGWRDDTPASLTIASNQSDPLQAAPTVTPVGTLGNPFRVKHVVQSRIARGNDGTRDMVVTFRSYDVFFREFEGQPPLTLPLTLGDGRNAYSAAQLSVNAPILLRGSQRIDLSQRYTLRQDTDDTANLGLGYAADHPPLVTTDQLIYGANTVATFVDPALRVSSQLTNPAANVDMGGAVTAFRLSQAVPTSISDEISSQDKIAWQFHGDTFGPRGMPWNGALPYMWRSDFPYPSAMHNEIVYAIGLYAGYGEFDGTTMNARMPATEPNRAVLYALDPKPSSYLRQVVSAGTVTPPDAGVPTEMDTNATLIITEATPYALRTGARALIKGESDVWDAGNVKLIRNTANASFYVEFDRSAPSLAWLNAQGVSQLLIATSTPYVSHIQGWNTITGAEVVRRYTRNGVTMTRLNEGISTTPGEDDPAVPKALTFAEAMIAFNHLQYTCHEPNALLDNTVTPFDRDLLVPNSADWVQWNSLDHLYLPRVQEQGEENEVGQPTTFNYRIDYRSGRIELAPGPAGEFADRFVLVHYFTREVDAAGNVRKVRHAEIMHVPSQVLWQYAFTDAIPDSGPVVANNTLYISVMRKLDAELWQPAVYAFPAVPDDPRNLRPLSVSAVGPVITSAQLPYRAITSPIPSSHGILVGTADKNSTENELVLLAGRGTLIADGHRLLRINGDGQVTWQASATRHIDPKAPVNTVISGAAVVQQSFVLITKVDRLPNGNILVCDTGGNRVVELDTQGLVIWQYPDATVDPARLSAPRDVRRYQSPEFPVNTPAGAAMRQWETTLIVDSGNQRIIEFYRSMTKLTTPDAYGPGYYYRPDLGDVQSLEPTVVADGKTIQLTSNKTLDKAITFTLALRYTGAATEIAPAQANGYASNMLLAVVGTPVSDPGDPNKKMLQTVLIQDGKIVHTVADAPVNVFTPRVDMGSDFVNIRQLDLITLYAWVNNAWTPEVHALIVDGSGVRQFPLAVDRQAQPVFEMRQQEYTAALSSVNWDMVSNALRLTTREREQLLRWRRDTLFAPVAVQRIDAGTQLVNDQGKARYLIAQMNTIEHPNQSTWLPDGNGKSVRRVHLFEARYLGSASPYNPPSEYRLWGIVDGFGRHYLFPTPWAADFPNIPGSTYPLTQPLSFERD